MTKEAIFIAGFCVAVPVCTFMVVKSRRLAELLFAAAVFGTCIPDRLDINFLSGEFYRGTTRGIEISFVDLLVLSLLLGMMLQRHSPRRLYWPTSFGWILAYTAYAAVHLLLNEPRITGVWELSKMLRGIPVFLVAAWFVRSRRDLEILLWALCAAVAFEAAVGLRDRYLLGIHRISATFSHPNILSMYCGMTAPLFVAGGTSDTPLPLRWACRLAALLAIGCVILTISRTGFAVIALMTVGTAAACMTGQSVRKQAVYAAILVLLFPAMAYKSWDSLQERYSQASLSDEAMSDEGRGMYFRLLNAIMHDTLWGVGLNNWSYWCSVRYGPIAGVDYVPYDISDLTRSEPLPENAVGPELAAAPPAHNLAVITMGELGVVGLLLFTGIWVQWFRMATLFLWRRTPALVSRFGTGVFFALVAAFLQSLTEWEFRQTSVYFLVHILLGALACPYRIRRRNESEQRTAAQPRSA